jgi:putative endonuclease
MNHYVYIIKSLKVKRFYVGYTTDLERRLIEHNEGNTRSTRPFMPWKMIYYEIFDNRSEAYKREWHLKHSKGHKEKLEIINKYGEVA